MNLLKGIVPDHSHAMKDMAYTLATSGLQGKKRTVVDECLTGSIKKGNQLNLFAEKSALALAHCQIHVQASVMRNFILATLIVLPLPCSQVVGQPIHETPSSHASLYSPDDIQWKVGPPSLPPGAKIAVLEGDPTKEGMFVMRVRVPDGFHIPAHTHPKPERVTVISGTFKLAMGDNPKKSDARALPAGTYGVWPAGMVHAVWIEGETIVQFYGMGPWVINYVNPADDPRNAKKAP